MMKIHSPKHNAKIIWLASYPKSGNTWFRSFLCALFTGNVDINQLETHGIFSSRHLFDRIHDIDSTLLSTKEVQNAYPDIFSFHAKIKNQPLFIKIHDSLHKNTNGKYIIPSDFTHKAVYLLRNPLDVVASFANHNATTTDRTIQLMNNKKGVLARQRINVNNQFPQYMQDWSGHVNSWTEQKHIETLTVRYEDMKHNPLDTFNNIMKELGFDVPLENIQKAIDLTQFEKLKSAEEKGGFKEKNIKSESFFRKGQTGGWKNELTKDQVGLICQHHQEVMTKFGYLPL